MSGTDLGRSEQFYRLLGLRLIVKSNHYLRFECPDGDSTFSVDLVEAVPFNGPPNDMPWLWREARFRDPDGHLLCLFRGGDNRHNPPWRVSD